MRFQHKLASLAICLVACGDDLAPQPDGAEAPVDRPTCEAYPIIVPPVADAEPAARAALERLSPEAALTWNPRTATLSSIYGLRVPLPGCSDGTDVQPLVQEILRTYPDLFQLDFDEWSLPAPFDCRLIDGALTTTIPMGRKELGGRRAATDIFVVGLARVDGVVTLRHVNATYLPPLPPAIGDAMEACSRREASDAEIKVRARTLPATVLNRCNYVDDLEYRPDARDTYTLLDDEAWTWWEDGDGAIRLEGTRTLRVTVAPENYTPELLSSTARCPKIEGGGFTIGFDVRFDVSTGEIVVVKAGLDCIVC